MLFVCNSNYSYIPSGPVVHSPPIIGEQGVVFHDMTLGKEETASDHEITTYEIKEYNRLICLKRGHWTKLEFSFLSLGLADDIDLTLLKWRSSVGHRLCS